jgi:hypothetical protein
MEDHFDASLAGQIDQLDWEGRRRQREVMLARQTEEFEEEINSMYFDDEDDRLNYIHAGIMRLNDVSPYIHREGVVTGMCSRQVYTASGCPRIGMNSFENLPIVNRGFTVFENSPPDGDDESEIQYVVGQLIEYTLEGETRYRMIDAKTSQADYQLSVQDYRDLLEIYLPLDMLQMFDKITDVYSDAELQAAVHMLAHMYVDPQHIATETLTQLSAYVADRLGIDPNESYFMVMNDHLYRDDTRTWRIRAPHPQAYAVQIHDIVLAPQIEGDSWQWFAQVGYIAPSGIHAREGIHLVPLDSIETMQRLVLDDSDDDA